MGGRGVVRRESDDRLASLKISCSVDSVGGGNVSVDCGATTQVERVGVVE